MGHQSLAEAAADLSDPVEAIEGFWASNKMDLNTMVETQVMPISFFIFNEASDSLRATGNYDPRFTQFYLWSTASGQYIPFVFGTIFD